MSSKWYLITLSMCLYSTLKTTDIHRKTHTVYNQSHKIDSSWQAYLEWASLEPTMSSEQVLMAKLMLADFYREISNDPLLFEKSMVIYRAIMADESSDPQLRATTYYLYIKTKLFHAGFSTCSSNSSTKCILISLKLKKEAVNDLKQVINNDHTPMTIKILAKDLLASLLARDGTKTGRDQAIQLCGEIIESAPELGEQYMLANLLLDVSYDDIVLSKYCLNKLWDQRISDLYAAALQSNDQKMVIRSALRLIQFHFSKDEQFSYKRGIALCQDILGNSDNCEDYLIMYVKFFMAEAILNNSWAEKLERAKARALLRDVEPLIKADKQIRQRFKAMTKG